MSQACSLSLGRIYGLARVTRVWNLSWATVYRSRADKPEDVRRGRPGPIGACPDAELAGHIRREIEASEFHGEGYRKIWARLRFSGVRARPRIHAAKSPNRFEALEPVRQGVRRCFGVIAPEIARGLRLRHDHGSNYMSEAFQGEIKCLGIEASPSFVREPEGNGVAERFIRTLKENLLWVRAFRTIEELRVALIEFAARYNKTWLVARHAYKTPDQVRAEQLSIAKANIAELPLAA